MVVRKRGGFKTRAAKKVSEAAKDAIFNAHEIKSLMALENVEEPEVDLLPVLGKRGKWKVAHSDRMTRDQNVPGTANEPSEEADDEGELQREEEVMRPEEEIIEEIALLGISLTEETEESIHKLKELFTYLNATKYSAKINSLTLLTASMVFKDILPGYPIRELTKTEQETKVSKDVKKIRHFEQTILQYYTRFLQILKQSIIPTASRQGHINDQVLDTLITCLHQMLQYASHFNHYEELIKLNAHALCRGGKGQRGEACSKAFNLLFEADEFGHNTLLAIRVLSQMIKDREYDCPPLWLKAIEPIQIHITTVVARDKGSDTSFAKAKPKQHLSAKQLKEWKAKREELERIAKAEAITSQEQIKRWNEQALGHLFRIYFGILKQNPKPDLLPYVLRGISRHAHHIGIEYFTDMLHSLRKLLVSDDQTITPYKLDTLSKLHCILTIDRIYSMNESLAAMDLKQFYNALFKELGHLIRQIESGKDPKGQQWSLIKDTLQKCLSALLHPKRIIPGIRAASFVQRLADLAIAFDRHPTGNRQTEGVIFALENMLSVLTHHPKTQALLDAEPFGQGVYQVQCDDPDLCYPFARPLLPLLSLQCLHAKGVKPVLHQITKLASE